MTSAGYARLSNVKRLILLFALSCFVALFILYRIPSKTENLALSEDRSPAANETLGFGAIYVLTDDATTWRVQGLRQAAAFAGLHLTVPVQSHPSDDEITAYLAGDKPTTGPHDIRASLNYMKLLETFLASGHETALFFEDDVDFDINIKSQMEVISRAIRNQDSSMDPLDPGDAPDNQVKWEGRADAYGVRQWDVFWIRHYGIEFTTNSYVLTYHDPYALPWDHLSSKYNNYYELIRSDSELQSKPSPQQIVYGSAPIGTYAFALTQSAARRMVTRLRKNRVQQFDRRLHDDCRELRQRCVAPIPSLMHHHRVLGPKIVGQSKTNRYAKTDLKWWQGQHKYTYNVQWSARCNAARVGEKLGNKYQCLPGRYDDNE